LQTLKTRDAKVPPVIGDDPLQKDSQIVLGGDKRYRLLQGRSSLNGSMLQIKRPEKTVPTEDTST
jgi:hypothetical protein